MWNLFKRKEEVTPELIKCLEVEYTHQEFLDIMRRFDNIEISKIKEIEFDYATQWFVEAEKCKLIFKIDPKEIIQQVLDKECDEKRIIEDFHINSPSGMVRFTYKVA